MSKNVKVYSLLVLLLVVGQPSAEPLRYFFSGFGTRARIFK